MSLSIMNNAASLTAQTNLGNTSAMMNQSLERLSTGFKINSGADGPAALVISEEQLNQIAGLQTAIDNTSKAVSMVQTTEGALGTINDLLTQIRSLALSSANSGANDANALAANQAQITNALDTIDRIAANTQFQTKHILNGSAGTSGSTDNANISFLAANTNSPVGTFAVNITTAAQRANTLAGTVQASPLAANESLTINGVAVQLTAGQTQASVISTINQYTGQTGVTAQVGAGGATQLYSAQFGSAAKITVQSNVAAAGTSSGFGSSLVTATGVDIAGTIGGFAATGNGNILTGNTGTGASGISVSAVLAGGSSTTTVTGAQGNVSTNNNPLVFQIGANANQTVSVSVNNVASSALGLNIAGNQFANLRAIDVRSQSGAQDAIAVVDASSAAISNVRGTLGAIQQDTLTQNQNNLQNTLVNTTAAEGVIRNTDFAAETANFTQDQVLMQVGTTVLQNANQAAQLVLNLTKNM
jgi:flagellin